ncbi:MAG: winged helix-turn-helix transcriptional regulator [Bdellovibrionales bacterium]|nr:winged helix-turn-helix transcriptional regulator [Bdellovibrionales bacterium]
MAKKKEVSIKNKTIYELQAKICSALSHPVRLEILDLLFEGEKNSTDLLEVLDIPKANLSQHLAVLKDAGIIQARKEGVFQYVSLSLPKIKDACHLVRGVLLEKMALEEKQNMQLIKELRAQR